MKLHDFFPPCLSKKVPALCRQSGFTDLSNIELATALRDEGRRLDGPLCRLEERLATLQTGRNYLPRSCVWLLHAAFYVPSAGIGGSIISFGELAHRRVVSFGKTDSDFTREDRRMEYRRVKCRAIFSCDLCR